MGGLFGYMTENELKTVDINPADTQRFEATGHDLESLLFDFLDNLLSCMDGSLDDYIMMRDVQIFSFDAENFKTTFAAYGEVFDKPKHTVGTDVKAITFNDMKLTKFTGDKEYCDGWHIWV